MKMLEQETPLGTLVARCDAGPNCPGMSIYLRCGEYEELLISVGCDPIKKGIAFHAWFDPRGYEYSHAGVLSENDIKQIFEED